MEKNWIGIIGQNGAGKSTVCDYFKEQGFYVISLSDVVRHYADQLQQPKDRDTLTRLANQMKAENGRDCFAKETVKSVSKQVNSNVVFDSVRHPDEMNYLMSFNTQFIGVFAALDVRYERIKSRQSDTDFVTFETFKEQDEYEALGASSGQFISECLNMCHYKIENDGSIDKLFAEIDDIIKGI